MPKKRKSQPTSLQKLANQSKQLLTHAEKNYDRTLEVQQGTLKLIKTNKLNEQQKLLLSEIIQNCINVTVNHAGQMPKFIDNLITFLNNLENKLKSNNQDFFEQSFENIEQYFNMALTHINKITLAERTITISELIKVVNLCCQQLFFIINTAFCKKISIKTQSKTIYLTFVIDNCIKTVQFVNEQVTSSNSVIELINIIHEKLSVGVTSQHNKLINTLQQLLKSTQKIASISSIQEIETQNITEQLDILATISKKHPHPFDCSHINMDIVAGHFNRIKYYINKVTNHHDLMIKTKTYSFGQLLFYEGLNVFNSHNDNFLAIIPDASQLYLDIINLVAKTQTMKFQKKTDFDNSQYQENTVAICSLLSNLLKDNSALSLLKLIQGNNNYLSKSIIDLTSQELYAWLDFLINVANNYQSTNNANNSLFVENILYAYSYMYRYSIESQKLRLSDEIIKLDLLQVIDDKTIDCNEQTTYLIEKTNSYITEIKQIYDCNSIEQLAGKANILHDNLNAYLKNEKSINDTNVRMFLFFHKLNSFNELNIQDPAVKPRDDNFPAIEDEYISKVAKELKAYLMLTYKKHPALIFDYINRISLLNNSKNHVLLNNKSMQDLISHTAILTKERALALFQYDPEDYISILIKLANTNHASFTIKDANSFALLPVLKAFSDNNNLIQNGEYFEYYLAEMVEGENIFQQKTIQKIITILLNSIILSKDSILSAPHLSHDNKCFLISDKMSIYREFVKYINDGLKNKLTPSIKVWIAVFQCWHHYSRVLLNRTLDETLLSIQENLITLYNADDLSKNCKQYLSKDVFIILSVLIVCNEDYLLSLFPDDEKYQHLMQAIKDKNIEKHLRSLPTENLNAYYDKKFIDNFSKVCFYLQFMQQSNHLNEIINAKANQYVTFLEFVNRIQQHVSSEEIEREFSQPSNKRKKHKTKKNNTPVTEPKSNMPSSPEPEPDTESTSSDSSDPEIIKPVIEQTPELVTPSNPQTFFKPLPIKAKWLSENQQLMFRINRIMNTLHLEKTHELLNTALTKLSKLMKNVILNEVHFNQLFDDQKSRFVKYFQLQIECILIVLFKGGHDNKSSHLLQNLITSLWKQIKFSESNWTDKSTQECLNDAYQFTYRQYFDSNHYKMPLDKTKEYPDYWAKLGFLISELDKLQIRLQDENVAFIKVT